MAALNTQPATEGTRKFHRFVAVFQYQVEAIFLVQQPFTKDKTLANGLASQLSGL